MENPLNNGCKPNEHYSVTQTAHLLGVTRPTVYNYIKRGYFKFFWHKKTMNKRLKGTDIIKFYNEIS